MNSLNTTSTLSDNIPIKALKTDNFTIKNNNSVQKIKGIIFDFDGVLSSFVARIGWPILSSIYMVKPDVTEEKLTEFSLHVFKMLNTINGQPKKFEIVKLAFRMSKQLGMTTLQTLKFMITLGIIYRRNRTRIIPTKGTRKVLQELIKNDYRTILVTNTSWKVINAAKKKIPELEHFDLILTRDDVKTIKPDTTGFRKALFKMKLKPEEVIVIGDQASDIIAGKRIGIKTIAVNNRLMVHTKPLLILQKPDFIIKDLRELPDILTFLRDCIIDDIRTTIDLTEKTMQEFLLEIDKRVCTAI